MRGDKKVILHLVIDGVFFDSISSQFDKLDGYENIYLYLYFKNVKELTYIKQKEKVIIAKDIDEWGKIINDPCIDIVYLHGLWEVSMYAAKYIRKEVIVMWWCYGREIYENCWDRAPLLPLKLYKPKTFRFMEKYWKKEHVWISKNIEYFLPKVYNIIKKFRGSKEFEIYLKEMLSRIDYLFTPLPLEYELLKEQCKYLRAKPYRVTNFSSEKDPIVLHEHTGNILFDHSAYATTNHLDLFNSLKDIDLTSRNMYIPMSYGEDQVKSMLKEHQNFNNSNTIFLEESIPGQEYKALIRSCSHAIFGATRQTALGNINLCIKSGVKVFLYSDSLLYKHCKRLGYKVYNLEKDLTQKELDTTLTKDEIIKNHSLFYKSREILKYKNYQQQIDEIYLENHTDD